MSLADTIDVVLRAEIQQYSDNMRKAEDITQKTTKSIEQKFSKLGRSLTVLTGGLTIAAIMQKAVKSFSEAEQGAIKLDNVLSSMGRGAGVLSAELKGLAEQIQSEGIISDDEIIRGQSMLATFDTISNEALPRVTRVMADFAAMTGGDARQAAMLLGRASAGMTETLARYGIVLSDDVKKSGDFNRVLDEIEKKVGGMNKALGGSASGSLTKFANAMDNVLESIGKVITYGIAELLPTDEAIGSWSETTVEYLDIAADSIDYLASRFKIGANTITTGIKQTYALLQADFDKVKELGIEYEKMLQEEIYKPSFTDRRKRKEVELELSVRTKGGTGKDDFRVRNVKAEKDALEQLSFAQQFQNEVFDQYLKQLDDATQKEFDYIQALEDRADPTREMARDLKRLDELYESGQISFEAWAEEMISINDKVASAIKSLGNTTEETVDDLTLFYEQALKNLQDATANLLENVLLGQVEDFEKEFKAMLARIAANLAASKLMELLMGKDGKSGWAGAAGDAVGNWVGSLFSGAAMGDTVKAGEGRVIGERGREVFIPKTDGVILSNEELARGAGGGGGVSVQNIFNISTGVSQTVRAELEQYAPIIEERSRQGVLAAIERGGRYAKAVNRRSS